MGVANLDVRWFHIPINDPSPMRSLKGLKRLGSQSTRRHQEEEASATVGQRRSLDDSMTLRECRLTAHTSMCNVRTIDGAENVRFAL